jgi:L-fucose isomerase-like protein
MVVGAIGARTTAFKTVRIDEVALQANGITMETLDLSDIFARMNALGDDDAEVQEKAAHLRDYTRWGSAPETAFNSLTRLAVVLDAVIEEYGMDALALRCWSEMQAQLGISPCVLLSALNDRGLAAACEVDVGNAVTMHALKLASGKSPALLDWNNNYGEEDDKCILFHCGPVAQNLMTGKGLITDHAILANAVGEGRAWGCNTGRISPGPFTFGSLLTQNGRLCVYLGEGEFTADQIPDDFFGCAGVAQIQNLQQKLQIIGYLGHRHHTSVTPTHVAQPVCEAFERYLGYEVTML